MNHALPSIMTDDDRRRVDSNQLLPELLYITTREISSKLYQSNMCDVPFFPIFPICFQCGTDQNPCRCKVLGPTLALIEARVLCDCRLRCLLLPSGSILWLLRNEDGKRAIISPVDLSRRR
ncbi:predicted protein [Aspergillus terreus NIH2624]|uniref:Uncharacterized protein n=1 Tax=Aspergillus terreus (strain NIH 2624 / FGSC A1156) TaxID=341663 RepID=Q0CP62_ASPTN|nr:uncharacterized protein ATEG_04522 [Aspergillus terreus NIH2624]EAU34969.1 predicted protein [Aspergillus terreus NIH2624]